MSCGFTSGARFGPGNDVIEWPWLRPGRSEFDDVPPLPRAPIPVINPIRRPPKETSGRVRDNSSEPVKRLKGTKLFFITVDVPEVYDNIRSDFLCNFSGVDSYCVAIEKHKGKSVNPWHLHAYIKFESPVLLGELSTDLHAVYEGMTVNVQKCRSEKSVLKYITKEDKHAFFNVSVDSLSFFYRMHYWAEHTTYFRLDDPFVVEHKHLYKYLQSVFNDIKLGECKLQLTPYVGKVNNEWSSSVVNWWNGFLRSKGFRRKQLYLWGGTGIGKSTLIEQIIGEKMMKYVFEVGDGRFAFDGLREDYHKVLLFEEFDWDEWKMKTRYLKRLLEGRRFNADMKGNVPLQLQWKDKPVIMISNNMCINDPAIIDRLCIVDAGEIRWNDGVFSLVKEEILSSSDSMEALTLSDSSQ